jgi:hypothetical protein
MAPSPTIPQQLRHIHDEAMKGLIVPRAECHARTHATPRTHATHTRTPHARHERHAPGSLCPGVPQTGRILRNGHLSAI